MRGGEIHNQEEGSEGEEEVENAQLEQIRQMLRPHAQEEHQKMAGTREENSQGGVHEATEN